MAGEEKHWDLRGGRNYDPRSVRNPSPDEQRRHLNEIPRFFLQKFRARRRDVEAFERSSIKATIIVLDEFHEEIKNIIDILSNQQGELQIPALETLLQFSYELKGTINSEQESFAEYNALPEQAEDLKAAAQREKERMEIMLHQIRQENPEAGLNAADIASAVGTTIALLAGGIGLFAALSPRNRGHRRE